ncbi:MAG: histidine ammonia-lyase [Gammaproteobacteria bacterium]|nr:histidine ammonia-lyase [Gammaproteobacteria bacterium]
MTTFTLTPGQLTLAQLRAVARGQHSHFALNPASHAAIQASAETVRKILAEDRTVYGINTGFGLLAQTRIPADKLALLQTSLVLSHAVGTGNLMRDEVVRLLMVLKISSLGRGHSGVRLELIEGLVALLNAGVYPCIPEKGSVGASGDLAPLAHMSLALIGEGEVRVDGRIVPAVEGLAKAGLKPIALGPKEGLALLNGTQASTALALCGLFMAEDAYAAAVVTGSLCVDAALGSVTPFDDRIHAVRGHAGQREVAAVYRELLAGSGINASHADCGKVQDPYSLRCQPQVMGACLDQLRHAASVLLTEANAVSDNPLVFPDDMECLSGGNFHAEPVAMAADNIAIAISEIGAISERRSALLLDKQMSQLPAFLVNDSGINSGFMIAQVTAAALASENKTLAHPASVDSLPTSANQEDHVSMATFAARRLTDMAENTAGVVAVELLAAAQGVDFRAPHKTSPKLQTIMDALRADVPFYDKDRYFAPDLEAAKRLVMRGAFNRLIPAGLLPSL